MGAWGTEVIGQPIRCVFVYAQSVDSSSFLTRFYFINMAELGKLKILLVCSCPHRAGTNQLSWKHSERWFGGFQVQENFHGTVVEMQEDVSRPLLLISVSIFVEPLNILISTVQFRQMYSMIS